MVVEVRFGSATTNAKNETDGGGSAFCPNHPQRQKQNRWWWKRVLAQPPPSPRSKPMVVEVRFDPTTTNAKVKTDGGEEVLPTKHHHQCNKGEASTARTG
ncbi:hypothetical protein K5I04_04175 [Murdochiella sp. Marseille-P8839]|nr:hypothetical protein [Murdochiella sp. Marseille-P8839]